MQGARFVGIDLGKRTYMACAISRSGSLEWWHGKTDGVARDHLAARLRCGDVVGVEAGSNASIYAILVPSEGHSRYQYHLPGIV